MDSGVDTILKSKVVLKEVLEFSIPHVLATAVVVRV